MLRKNKKLSVYTPLVATGYTLFALLIVAVLMSTTIPMGMMLFRPDVLHGNIIVMLLALSVGAILPLLLAYLIGDGAVKTKYAIRKHFNGVLFGLLAYWVMTFPVLFYPESQLLNDNASLRITVYNLVPAMIAAAIAGLIATLYLYNTKADRDLHEYKPFSVVLVGSIVVLQIWQIVYGVMNGGFSAISFIAPAVGLFIGIISYITLAKTKLTPTHKVTWAAISVSVLFVALFVASQLFSSFASLVSPQGSTQVQQTITTALGIIAPLVVWTAYWRAQRKTLLRK